MLLLALVLCFSSASTIQAYFVLCFPILRWVSPLLFVGILQGIAVGIGTSNFLRAAFIVSLNSSSFCSIKNIPLNCLALSSFGFSIAQLCFAFFLFFAASDIKFHISGHTSSGREVFCFLVSLLPDHVYPSGGFSFGFFFSIHVPVIFNLFFQHYVQWRVWCSGNVDVLQRNRKRFFFRHVQFDSWYNVMTINEFFCDRPEVIFSFLIIARRVVFVLVLVRDAPGYKVDVLRRCSPPKDFYCSICDWEIWSFHFFAALTLPSHWAFWRGVQMRPSLPILQCLGP